MFFHSFELSLLGEAYLAAGRLEEATQFAERAFHLACERDERGHQAWALRLIGEIATQHTPAEVTAAGDAYQQALTLARQLGSVRSKRAATSASARCISRQDTLRPTTLWRAGPIWRRPLLCSARWTCSAGCSGQEPHPVEKSTALRGATPVERCV